MSRKESKSNIPKKYKYQVILNFIDSDSETPLLLRKKWIQNNDPSKCSVIVVSPSDDLTTYNPKFSVLADLLTPADTKDGELNARLDIIGHCTAGALGLSNDAGYFYPNENIANLLQLHLKKGVFKLNDKSKLKISLVACQAAAGSDPKDLFSSSAAHLHQLLMEKNIGTEISARVKLVTVERGADLLGRKQTLKLELSEEKHADNLIDSVLVHKQPGSKILFSFFKVKQSLMQVAHDAYSETWKEKVLTNIVQLIQSEKDPETKAHLEELQDRFKDLPPLNILAGLDQVLNMKHSFINKKNYFDFFKTSTIQRDFEKLFQNGKHFLLNKNTSPTKYRALESKSFG